MVKIYHNKRCSKSRETLELLENCGIHPEVVLYMEEGLSQKEIVDLLNKLSLKASDLVRKKEALFKELNLRDASEKEIIKAMSQHPQLFERPVVVNGNKAAIGRPAEKVLTII
ncbi:MAG: arsenate reductase (glutaredoxin) [Halobacteriovoraceae bacterium]|nr:arsenate reductase (glutaredoxin) [Halobacteriovoraceae bacterium]MCB9093758.1 arsenate reductase (glutaredoxin) [Halobacteriovoraceae bacterium]